MASQHDRHADPLREGAAGDSVPSSPASTTSRGSSRRAARRSQSPAESEGGVHHALDEPRGAPVELLPQAHDVHVDELLGQGDEVVDPNDWRSYILDKDRTVNLMQLCWDHHASLGQVRPLRRPLVNYYVQRLLAQGEPVTPVKVMTKLLPGVSPHPPTPRMHCCVQRCMN